MLNKIEKNRMRENKAITLIALIITIIVLLILAGVAFSTLAGENGVVNRAQKAVELNKQGQALDEISLAWTELLADWYEDWSTKGVSFASCVTQENLQKYLGETSKADSTGTIGTVTDNGDKTYTIEYTPKDNPNSTYIFLAEEKGKVSLVEGLKIIHEATNGLNLEVVSNAAGETTKTPKTFKASLTKAQGVINWTTSGDTNAISLSSTTGNEIQVTPQNVGTVTLTATTQDGLYTDSCIITVTKTAEITSVTGLTGTNTINVGNTTLLEASVEPRDATESLIWTSSDPAVAGITESQDTRSATISGLAGGTSVIRASNQDGSKYSETTITVNVPVTVTFMNGTTTYTTKNTISGSSLTASNWPADPTPEDEYHEFVGWFNAQTNGTEYTYSTTISNNVTLYARWNELPRLQLTAPLSSATVDDSLTIANDRGEIEVIWLDGKTNTKATTANVPNERTGMTHVTWHEDETTWEEDTTPSATWYNYDTEHKQWANVKDPAGSYFVWIPRFAYRITYYDGNNVVGYYDGYGLWTADGTQKREFSDIVSTAEYDEKRYIVHNAFLTNVDNGGGFGTVDNSKGEDGVTGIWVAKYEMVQQKSEDGGSSWSTVVSSLWSEGNVATVNSGTTRVRAVSIPNETSWIIINVANCYTNSKNYGTQTFGSTSVKSHLMKNSEWGAVVYLAHSQYGLNGTEIAKNNSSSFITGTSGGTSDASSSGSTYAYNNKTNGVKASTTGNIYGIYDLSGGASEFVALFNKYYSANFFGNYYTNSYCRNTNGDHFARVGGSSDAYSTAYSNDSTSYDATTIYTVGITGDATKEVYTGARLDNAYRAWFNDYFSFLTLRYPFVARGLSGSGSGTGFFSSMCVEGAAATTTSFRVVLAP